jgi:GNAT superfamily N-acetyltransferase
VSDTDAVRLCARGESTWHRLGLSALGVAWEECDGVARRSAGASRVYLGALTVSRGGSAAALHAAAEGLAGEVSVRDSFGGLDLEPQGWARADETPWMLRSPGALPALPRVAGMRIEPVGTPEDVVVFEHTAAVGASGDPTWHDRGSIHPSPGSLQVHGLTLLLARLEGDPVGTALAAVGEESVHVSAVAVMPRARRLGVATLLTAGALSLAPGLPATLGSSEQGRGVYLRLGFREVGTSVRWVRGGAAGTPQPR